MKLSTFALTLFFVSSVLGINTTSDYSINEVDLKYMESIKKCQNNIQGYIHDCGPEELTNNEESCNKVLNDNKCKEYFENSTSKLDGCNQLPVEYITYYDNQRDFAKSLVKLACEKDENGKTCPITDILINLESNNEKDISNVVASLIKDEDKMIQDTCTSKICTDNSISFIDSYLKFKSEDDNSALDEMLGQEIMKITINELKTVSNKLKDNECIQAHVQSDGTISSSVRLGTTILVTLGLLINLL